MLFAEGLLLVLCARDGDDLDDATLARRIRDGDGEAFRHFFNRYHDGLYRYLRSRKVPPQVAEDLVQKAFVMIWEKRATIDPGKSLRAYLFRIGYTRALNHFRDTAKYSYEADLTRESGTVGMDNRRDRALIRETFDKAVRNLPERRRAVFELCFLHDLTYKETAQAMGISPKTVENQMGHALKALRKALAIFREEDADT